MKITNLAQWMLDIAKARHEQDALWNDLQESVANAIRASQEEDTKRFNEALGLACDAEYALTGSAERTAPLFFYLVADLKPCPKCGGKCEQRQLGAVVQEGGFVTLDPMARHQILCVAPCGYSVHGTSFAQAVKNHNRRAADAL